MQLNIEPETQEEVPSNRSFLSSLHRQVVSRMFFSMTTIYLICWVTFDSNAMLHKIVVSGGVLGLLSSLGLLWAAAVALVDVVINDILPEKYSIKTTIRYRHFIWGAIAVTYLGYAQVLSKSVISQYGAGYYAMLGLWAAVIAAMDVYYEYVERVKEHAPE